MPTGALLRGARCRCRMRRLDEAGLQAWASRNTVFVVYCAGPHCNGANRACPFASPGSGAREGNDRAASPAGPTRVSGFASGEAPGQPCVDRFRSRSNRKTAAGGRPVILHPATQGTLRSDQRRDRSTCQRPSLRPQPTPMTMSLDEIALPITREKAVVIQSSGAPPG